jgi:hypothetical protein
MGVETEHHFVVTYWRDVSTYVFFSFGVEIVAAFNIFRKIKKKSQLKMNLRTIFRLFSFLNTKNSACDFSMLCASEHQVDLF